MEDKIGHQIFRIIEQNPQISQRELSDQLGVSLGKANYCLKALIDKGWIKVNNFRNSKNKWAYSYLLTPAGLEEKARITVRYLRFKLQEYEALKNEIAELDSEAKSLKLSQEKFL